MWRKAIPSLFAVLLAASPALAQSGRVTGTVTTADGGNPVPSAQVRLMGTAFGTLSREDGRYTIVAPAGTYMVRVSRIGYAPDSQRVQVTAGSDATANFALRSSATQLTGVVVTGYGVQEERDRTGVIATVTPEEFNTGRIVSPEELIRAKVPGVQVVDNNEPGGGISLRVRGGTSINASNEPLYVIDGVPLQVGGGASAGRNPLNFLNPNDIASITVLKDASSTAIYGARGANGVVIITTKNGATGPQFTYNGTVSGSQSLGGADMMNAAEYRAAMQQYGPALNQALLGNANTNWIDAVQRDAGGVEHNLGINGRREDMAYRLGLGYLDQSGVLYGTRTQRASLAFNASDKLLNDRLTLRTAIKGSRTKDWFTPGGVLGGATSFDPTQPVQFGGRYTEFDRDLFTARGIGDTLSPNNLAVNNPIAELAAVQDNGNTLRSIGNLEAEYAFPFISGLTATVRGGYDVVRANRTTFTPSFLRSQLDGDPDFQGNFSRNIPEQQNTVLDAWARWDRQFDPISSRFDVTAGFSSERFRGDYPFITVSGLDTDLLGPSGIPSSFFQNPSFNVDEYQLRSGFFRGNWNLLDRYLLTGTVRRDGSSRFRLGNQYGTFPSAAFAWRPLEEPFLKGRELPLSDLKVRLSWGENGNQSTCNYCAATNYALGTQTAQAQFGQTFVPTIRPRAVDENLTWETTTSTNFGIDFGVLANRVTGSIELYTKRTDDLLFEVPTAAGTALSNVVTTNIGSVRNRGFELSLDARVWDGGRRGFTWDANFNASTNRNEFLSLNRPGLNQVLTGGIAGGVGTRIQVLQPGLPVNSFYVYEHIREGGRPIYRDRNGDGQISDIDLYVDRDTNGIINDLDRRAYKNPAPRWILGHTSNMTWRGFDASTTIRAYLGAYTYNNVASNLGNYSVVALAGAPTNLHRSVLETGFERPQYFSDVYVEDASFIRMDNLTVGYTFERLAQLQRPRVFGTIQNVFTSTDYSGVDPTAGVNGIDNNIYPRSRTFLAGLSVGF